jgi:hypothetical protein
MDEELTIPVTTHPGIREHFIRAVMFNNLAIQIGEPANKFRVMIAAIYSCRAIAELMLERADREELTVDRVELKELLAKSLPFFNLVERIRIHDFHRYGLFPPNPGVRMISGRGPIKITASGGVAGLQYTSDGPKMTVTGNSKIQGQRPLFDADGLFFDEESQVHVSLSQILAEYLKAAPSAVDEYEKLLNEKGRVAHPTPELFPHLYGREV